MKDESILFERPDADAIDIIKSPSGKILHAKKRDNSVLAYLLIIGMADHGHEAAANTFLDWHLAYNATRGFKIANYGATYSGTGDETKASLYMRLIRNLGLQTQKQIEFCLNPENLVMELLLARIRHTGFEHGTEAANRLEEIGKKYMGCIDRLSRSIAQVRQEFEDDVQKVVDASVYPR